MSRESDTSSSGPQGHGGAAYPSGTPPYGTRQYPSLHPQGEPDGGDAAGAGGAPKPEEPRTETTLTTRIRINIPGSRPIPPVVMRTPVEDRSSAVEPGEPGSPAAAAAPPAAGAQRPAAPGAPDRREEPAGPAKPGAQKGGERASDWFAPRKASPAPPPAAPAQPGPGGPPPSGSVPGAPGAGPGGPRPGGPVPGPGNGARPGDTGATPAFGTPAVPGAAGAPGVREPSGPTTGPAGGDMPLLPPAFRQQGRQDRQDRPGAPRPPQGTGPVPGAAPRGPLTPPGAGPGPQVDHPFGSAGTGPAAPPGPGPEERVSSDTLVSGIHVVPPAGDSPFAPGQDEDRGPRPPEPPAAASPAPAAPKKKGRSKLVLAGAGVVGLLGAAYAAGLLLDHAEVPKGTTVLGTDIGGSSKEEAVAKLDKALGKRVDAPLTVTVDGKKHELKPSVVGLGIDTEATVREAAGRDYNPVSVIGSLFGGTREAEAQVKDDKEKLSAALQELAAGTGGDQEAGIKFVNGEAIAAEGKPHKALDVGKAVTAVSEAYHARAESGTNAPVALPVSVQQPSVGKAEIDRAMKEFAEPAMSGLVTVRTDPAHTISFSPENSLPKFLSMKAVDGKLVESYDLKVLKSLYGGSFDGVLIQRGNGSKTPVTPQDVAVALGRALRATDPAERIVTIDTNPQ